VIAKVMYRVILRYCSFNTVTIRAK